VDDTLVLPVTPPAHADEGRERLGSLFDAHRERLYRLARRLVDDGEEARDLVQEAFLRAAGHLASLPPGDEVAQAWLVRTLVNLCRDRLRRRRVRRTGRHRAEAAVEPSPAGDPEAAAVARATVERALSRLPPRRRAVLVMADLDGLPVARIAALLGIGRVTVRWHLSRARGELAAALGAAAPGEETTP
jgi:RNA polymerase sigma-70 factor (ECF subfamily)